MAHINRLISREITEFHKKNNSFAKKNIELYDEYGIQTHNLILKHVFKKFCIKKIYTLYNFLNIKLALLNFKVSEVNRKKILIIINIENMIRRMYTIQCTVT